ncbi:hypothetical protein F5888DRAFT_1822674 [Russula emetica]|nr:hypothetical protein F5888DRAFT_1822674 [Russula emetica]
MSGLVDAAEANGSTIEAVAQIHPPPPLANMADNDTSRRMVTRPKNTSMCRRSAQPFRFITYITLLTFVLLVTMGKEAYDEYKRNLRDHETNSARYLVLASGASSPSDEEELSHSLLKGNFPPTRSIPSSSIRVGDLVLLEKNQRVPADLILLRTSDSSGTCFIRTDQLDGETDWKLRIAVPATQKLPFDHELLNLDAEIYADAPSKDIHAFIGTSTINTLPTVSSNEVPMVQVPTIKPLSAENVLWANTVLAAGDARGDEYESPTDESWAIGPRNQSLAKILCAVSFVLSVALVALNGFRGFWYIYVFQFLILFSSIIPISSLSTGVQLATRGCHDMSARIRDVVLSLALCHNVTPVTNDDGSVTYQASSPDEVAIVNWTSSVGLTLTFRDRTRIELRTPSGTTLAYDVLEIFPLHPNLSVWAPLCTIHIRKSSQIVQRNDWLKEDMAK